MEFQNKYDAVGPGLDTPTPKQTGDDNTNIKAKQNSKMFYFDVRFALSLVASFKLHFASALTRTMATTGQDEEKDECRLNVLSKL